jgi:BlaI family penicillinase repressor
MRRLTHDNVRPTEFELELLQLLWTKNGATVRDLYEALSKDRELGYTTVLKTLQIMTEKGLVEREEAGKAHLYRAVRSEQQTRTQFIGYLSERLFDGSAAQLVLHALSTESVGADELNQIKELILQKESRG